MTKHLLECGCVLEYNDNFLGVEDCPRHVAAYAMYEAVKDALENGFEIDGRFEMQFVIGEDDLAALKGALAIADGD